MPSSLLLNKSSTSFLYMLALCLPVTIACIDVMAVSVALAPIMQEFSSTIYSTQWLLSGYTIGTAAFLIMIGRFADIYGRRKLLIMGVILFAISSFTGAISNGIFSLILSRFFQGVASSMMMTTVISIITHEFTPKERGQVILTYGLSLGLGMASGPAVGGLLITYFNWRAIFLVNLPICLLSLWLITLYLPESKDLTKQSSVDWLEALLLSSLLLIIVLGISQGGVSGWSSPLMMMCAFIFIFLSVIFFIIERSKENPLVDMSLFKQPNYFGATMCGFVSYYCMYAWLCVIGLYLQDVAGYTVLKAALLCTPFSLAFAFSSKVLGKVITRFTPKTLMQCGFLISICTLLWMATIITSTSQAIMLSMFFLLGVGITIINAPSMVAATEYVPSNKAGIASGLIFTIRWLGGSVGVVAVTLIYHHYSETLFYPCISLALVALVGLFMTLTLKYPRVAHE